MKWLPLLVVCSGCLSSDSVVCGDGRLCPAGTVCDTTHALCVTPDQQTVCTGLAEGGACMAGAIAGHCQDGVCLHATCGDSIVEYGEMCDDGNTIDGDTCAADCLSNLTCGNGVVDSTTGEQCDDSGLLDHDGCSSRCQLEQPHWVLHTLAPGPRNNAASAYDPRRDQILVFGGIAEANNNYVVLGDTLAWSGGDWVRLATPTAPQARYASAMAFDEARGVAVMYGGFDGTFDLSDTWLWDGAAWSSVNVPGPLERYGHGMAYDAKRKVVVVFGGFNDQMGVINDTWEWDGTTWTQNTSQPAPPPREFANMAYDPRTGVIVMTGGDVNTVPVGDTWIYDGTWHDVTPTTAKPQVAQAGFAFDIASQQLLLYGGLVGFTAQQTLWAWTGSTWTSLGNAPIPARRGPIMVGTPSRTVLLGGGVVTNPPTSMQDTWVLASNTWSQVPDLGARRELAATIDFQRGRALLFGGQDPSGGLHGDLWQLSRDGFTVRSGPPPAKRNQAAMAFDPVHDNLVLFGGFDFTGSIYYNDTWVWNGTSWSQKTQASPPATREGAAIGFDGTRLILFGGVGATTTYGDTWAWDGSAWNLLSPATSPLPRTNAAVGYDPIRKQLVLFGGAGTDYFDDTWVWDGTTWTDVSTSAGFRPNHRAGAALMWNPARKTLILAGGNVATTDAFEWDGAHWSVVPALDVPPGRSGMAGTAALDGAGVMLYGGMLGSGTITAERWELRWDAREAVDRCDANDGDGDGLVGCADSDCWPICTPLCMPGTTCTPGLPSCGDHTCDATRETCRTCEVDCGACAPVCGDAVCDPGETGCPGECP